MEMVYSDFAKMLEDQIDAPDAKKGRILMEVGAVLTDYDQTELGLAVWNQALQHCIKTGDRKAEGRCRRDIGTVYQSIGNVLKAWEAYEEALRICEKIGDRIWVSMILSDIRSLSHPNVNGRKSFLFGN